MLALWLGHLDSDDRKVRVIELAGLIGGRGLAETDGGRWRG